MPKGTNVARRYRAGETVYLQGYARQYSGVDGSDVPLAEDATASVMPPSWGGAAQGTTLRANATARPVLGFWGRFQGPSKTRMRHSAC